jgi:FixJ family two-component response regulator
MACFTAELTKKQVATELGLNEITVKFHQGHVIKKMAAQSLADLVRAGGAPELRQAEKSAAQTSV